MPQGARTCSAMPQSVLARCLAGHIAGDLRTGGSIPSTGITLGLDCQTGPMQCLAHNPELVQISCSICARACCMLGSALHSSAVDRSSERCMICSRSALRASRLHHACPTSRGPGIEVQCCGLFTSVSSAKRNITDEASSMSCEMLSGSLSCLAPDSSASCGSHDM